MILNAIIDATTHHLRVPDALLNQAEDFYTQLDRDMAGGWQMSRTWVNTPAAHQRAQIVADKLLTALEAGNEKLGLLMAGYLLARLPGLVAVALDTQGDMQNHQFTFATTDEITDDAVATMPAAPERRAGLSKIEAMAQAGREVTPVFRVGRGWRFSVFDQITQCWQDAPLTATEIEANTLRQTVFKARYDTLCQE
ncbi:hypothetical protein [Chromatium okenii]|uniref:hypothetical protein n=1 Tax=Chromatium okenii TaxID=61644 RepID=UPI0026F1CFB3|nr:hypothetical protein [Chromatium okenii]MBV5310158.1 hypothetical protein [Chromatium okenii]